MSRRLQRVVAVVMLAALVAVATGCGGPVAGGPLPSPRVTCTGLPTAKCDEALRSVARSLPNAQPVAIDVTCVAKTCTLADGDMETVVTLADGRELRGTTLSWAGGSGVAGGAGRCGGDVAEPEPPGAGLPALPVAPVCQGVPAARCDQMAAGWAGEPGHGAIVKIVVTCTKIPCTDREGEGDAFVTFADGTSSSGGWGYSSID